MAEFYEKYQDRLLYGTDNVPEPDMYEITFRIMETLDEHFYYYRFYHWPSYGWGLKDQVLKKIYQVNPKMILKKWYWIPATKIRIIECKQIMIIRDEDF